MIKLVAFNGYYRSPLGGQPVQQLPITAALAVMESDNGITIGTKTREFFYPWSAVSFIERELVPSVAKATK